jgi:8-oxo-dGTP pyrophosphatase MutT (NUDIX family)
MQFQPAASHGPFNETSFRDAARRKLHTEPPELARPANASGPSDFDLNPEILTESSFESAPRAAAVLVPVVKRPELSLLFTLRTDHLPAHAGQIAFPGGKIEEEDESPLAAALREAEEEIGLDPRLVEPLGFLDSYRTGTGYRITPVVALVDPGFALTLNRNEVVDAFEVPLPFLMDARNHQVHARELGGRERRFYAMPYGDRFIWGATAGILKNMHERLFRS